MAVIIITFRLMKTKWKKAPFEESVQKKESLYSVLSTLSLV